MLIVDDHDVVAQALMLSLQLHGLTQVAVAADLSHEGVLTAARDFEPDVALVDYYLGDDATALSMIRPLTRMGVVVLVLTGSKEPANVATCLEAGAAAILDKSAPLDDLVDVLNDAAMGRTVMRPATRDALLEAMRARRADEDRRLGPFRGLTARERDVLAAMIDGKSAEVMATEHHVSLATIRTQIRAVLRKLDVNSQLAAVALARRAHWEPSTH